ncbi:hypothetical protein LSH36_1169g00015 [Paralvinella palmiformis]|uniref:Uncharacterized protein n=1 Tax=Paralvinella palmiformis TaxID=53620 RepID=A0AAD9IU93_9ANNE|nr:hypothetical protein LSH36_1169g00015 [Paralvinella palmiformis]
MRMRCCTAFVSQPKLGTGLRQTVHAIPHIRLHARLHIEIPTPKSAESDVLARGAQSGFLVSTRGFLLPYVGLNVTAFEADVQNSAYNRNKYKYNLGAEFRRSVVT